MEQSGNCRGIIGMDQKHNRIEFEELWNKIIGKTWRRMASSLLDSDMSIELEFSLALFILNTDTLVDLH